MTKTAAALLPGRLGRGGARARDAPRLVAQSIPVDLELGYRFVDVSGNDQMYRTQINDRPGLLLRSLDFTGPELLGGGALLDTLHVDASDVGAGPAGQLRFVAGQNEIFQLRFTLARDRPLQRAAGLRQSLPRPRASSRASRPGTASATSTTSTLELLPGKIVTPLLGYTRNTYDGPGTTTYHLGENEFLLNQQVHSVDELYRVGLGFNYAGIQARLHAGLAAVRLEIRRDARAGGRRRQRHDADPRPDRSRPTRSSAPRTTRSTRP